MKNKIFAIIVTIIIGIGLSYLYNNTVLPYNQERLKKFQKKVDIKEKKARQNFELLKDTYLLKIKSTARENQPKEVFVNGLQVTPNIPPYIRTRRGTEVSYIYLPKEIIRQGKNSIEIVFLKDYPPDVVVTLSNYRKQISNDIYILFFDSAVSPSGNIPFKTSLLTIILFFLLFGTTAYFLSKILFLSINRVFFYQVYSILPFLVILSCLWIGDNLSKEYKVVVTPYYFWSLGFISFLIAEICLFSGRLFQVYKLLIAKGYLVPSKFLKSYNLEDVKKKEISFVSLQLSNKFLKSYNLEDVKKKEISFVSLQLSNFSLKAISWIKKREFADKCIILFVLLLVVCALFLILHLRLVAVLLANIAYLALMIGIIIKFAKLVRRNENCR